MKRIRQALTATLALLFSALAPVASGLEIWIGEDKGYQGLVAVAERYQQKTGTPVRVRHFTDLPAAFEAAAPGERPDILLWAHDRYGEWAERGLLAPIEPGVKIKKEVAPFTWRAVTYEGHIWGYPIAVETLGLIYNRALIPAPPTTFEAMVELDSTLSEFGQRAISWNYTEPYFSWGLLAADGAYPFAPQADGYNVHRTGIDSDGVLRGAALLRRLVASGTLNHGIGSDSMIPFLRGQAAMTIGGPWHWAALREAGIDFAIAPLPTVNGQPGRPFVGVWAAAIAAASTEQPRAVDFLENHLLRPESLLTLNADKPLGAPANRYLMGLLAADPAIDTTFDIAVQGMMMPNVPRMGRFWQAMDTALEAIAHSERPLRPILEEAARHTTAPL